MELFYLYLLLAGILLVISIITGVEFLISGDDYAGTRLVEFIVATVVVFVFSIGHYISARIKEKKEKEGKGTV